MQSDFGHAHFSTFLVVILDPYFLKKKLHIFFIQKFSFNFAYHLRLFGSADTLHFESMIFFSKILDIFFWKVGW